MRFSIITPSFRNSDWLKLCIASVADQKDVEHEHIVQDSCSDDGTQDWLPHDSRVQAFIEKDNGMYDAVNRGFKRATGDVLAYLNCDEQYLPGALAAVARFFEENPEVDACVTDTVIMDPNGGYLCHRLALTPGRHSTWVRFPVVTSSFFLRRRVLHEMGLYFDTNWRDLGDFFYVMKLLNQGVRFGALPVFTSAFTDTGDNMNMKPNALREKAEKIAMMPWWIRSTFILWIAYYGWRNFLRGAYSMKPFDYAIYTSESTTQRVMRRAEKPTALWPGRPLAWRPRVAKSEN